MHSHPEPRQVDSGGGPDHLPIHCPLCRAPIAHPTELPPQFPGQALASQVLAAIIHDIRSSLGPLRNVAQLMQISDLGSDKGMVDQLTQMMSRLANNVANYVDYLRTLMRIPSAGRDIPLDELPRLHEELNAVLRVDWATDTSALAGGAGRTITGEYFHLLAVIAHAVLLTICQSSRTSVRVAYQVEADRLVGRADVADAAGVDPDGWNLVRLAAAVYNVPVAAEAVAGTLTVRWEVPLG